MDEDKARHTGIVKVSLPMLNYLFGNKCTVLNAVITDDDLRSETISLVVADHESLPLCAPGERLQEVVCTFTTTWGPETDQATITNSLPILHPHFAVKT